MLRSLYGCEIEYDLASVVFGKLDRSKYVFHAAELDCVSLNFACFYNITRLLLACAYPEHDIGIHVVSSCSVAVFKRCASAGNSDRNVSVRLSVRHAPVLCQNGISRDLSTLGGNHG